ncbi:MAG: class I SAM-dependent methyltransferase [Methanomicrobiales archaeon]|nr:class I SAM-dependent methyltransferase [Methanomicrobiales archaeon]
MILETIDWNDIWKKDRKNTLLPLSDIDEKNHWDTIAPLFKQWMEVDDYPEKLISRTQLHSDWSVLDIGCGTGTITIEAAKRSKSVTALDISNQMLDILKSDAKNRNISNITCVHSPWQDIRIGTDIMPHDIVITSRSLARIGDLRESLTKINQAAIKYAYVTAWGGSERILNRGLMEALGYTYHNIADYVYVFNILHSMGIRPNVEQINCNSRTTYPTLEDAVQNYASLLHLSSKDLEITRLYLEKTLIKQDNGMYLVPDSKPVWSLIWWKK